VTPRRIIEPARLAGAALLHTQSDERLVDLARAGNERAFEVIVGRYRGPLLRYCRRLLPPERAEDAVQQTFLNAYRAIGTGGAELNLRPWLYRIAHNAALSLLRQNGWNHEAVDDQFDGVVQPPQAVEQRERVRDVVRAVQDLPARQRDAVILRELEGRSYDEIAAELGVTGGAVRQLLNRARNNLRAAATAVTPGPLAGWVAARGSSAAPAAERIAELSAAGAGSLAVAGKLAALILVTGAVVGGGTGAGPLPAVLDDGGASPGLEEADAAPGSGSGMVPRTAALGSRDDPDRRRDDDRTANGSRQGDERGDDESAGPGPGDGDGDNSAPGSDSSGSGSGDGDNSGPSSGSSGSGGDEDGSGPGGGGSSGSGSGSGSGSTGSGSGSSGSGSDDVGGSSSGSSDSDSGSSSVTSGSRTSGSSGSDSGTSGSGSTGSSS
jgi:RNA polymerase sigma factor (sigma-70 family)